MYEWGVTEEVSITKVNKNGYFTGQGHGGDKMGIHFLPHSETSFWHNRNGIYDHTVVGSLRTVLLRM
jgi:hypothetical protein